ncbi:MAG TPA: methyltransferase domain-containing protein [Candidatus Angelobacter sp.]|jgi:ubiquinone/menaquinone biosynthesis C-methylase UbiE|nr:methyltransferase domain-containing protein [Candidatus Angelobacter sp.]
MSTSPTISTSYDTLAVEYTRRIYTELQHKPFDRQQLDHLANLAREKGTVIDLGCGPGQVARYLADRGVNAFGVDLSHGMLAEAQKLNPEIPFVQGNMLALPIDSNRLAGIAAFYSIIHLERSRVPDAFAEMFRVLLPNGHALLTFHLGADALHTSELWGYKVDLDVTLFSTDEITSGLVNSGFAIEADVERDPYPPDVEYQSRRGYVLAKKPG